MTTINVQFSDSTETTIVAYFGNPQDAEVFPNQAAINANDSRWLTFYNAQPAWIVKELPVPTT